MNCKNCGKEVDSKAVVCPGCGCALKAKKPIYKKWWFWVLSVLVLLIIIGASSGNDSGETQSPVTSGDSQTSMQTSAAVKIPEEFASVCPISVSATVSENIIGVTELHVNIQNDTDKEILAVKLYFSPKDVYGKDINTIFTTKELMTDEPIEPNASCSRHWTLLEDGVKSGDIYIYSVYFADGSEWGDKDASVTRIKKYGTLITVES